MTDLDTMRDMLRRACIVYGERCNTFGTTITIEVLPRGFYYKTHDTEIFFDSDGTLKTVEAASR